jgi:small subunit ribosomal protein S13
MAQLSYIKNTEFKNLVRMIGTSIDGDRLVQNGLNQIKGVGARLAQAIIKIMKIDPKTRMGMLTDAQIEEIEKMIKSPAKYGIPNWMLNRQKDISTGENRHISGTDIDLVLKLD